MSSRTHCLDECRRCAGLFRLGRDIEAALLMVDVFEEAQRLLALSTPDVQRQWARLLVDMLACQERQDWLGLADFMDVELTGSLETG
jgi:hypothetical protein